MGRARVEQVGAGASSTAWVWPTRRARSERALVRAAHGGSPTAAEELARRYWDEVHHVAFLIVRDARAAEDLAQEAIVAALGSLERFDRRRAFRPWLHRIAANRAIDWARAEQRRREVSIEEVPAMAAAGPTGATGGPGGALGAALAKLDAQTRALVVLRYLLDYRAREIARMFDLTPGAVRTRLHRALAQLRQSLEDEEDR